MKQKYKALLLTAGAVLLYFLAKASPKKSVMNLKKRYIKFKPEEIDKLVMLEQSLINAGFTEPQLTFAIAQLLYETGRFSTKSSVAKLNNNYTGIKWLNAKRQKATKGTPVPVNERSKTNPNWPLNWYAKFENFDDWAVDFKRILSLKRSSLGRPIEATDLKTYVQRLKANEYFGGYESSYLKGTKMYFDMLAK